MRLAHARQFKAVYESRAKRAAGPLVVHAMPNDRAHHRLGLAVGRHLGLAVERSRRKRLAREAFRLAREAMPTWTDEDGVIRGYDIVIVVRHARPATLTAYQTALLEAVEGLHALWVKRRARRSQ